MAYDGGNTKGMGQIYVEHRQHTNHWEQFQIINPMQYCVKHYHCSRAQTQIPATFFFTDFSLTQPFPLSPLIHLSCFHWIHYYLMFSYFPYNIFPHPAFSISLIKPKLSLCNVKALKIHLQLRIFLKKALQGIGSIIGSHKIDGEMLKMVQETEKSKNLYVQPMNMN